MKDELVGAWELATAERRMEDGRIDYPLGREVKGLLIYLPDGRMSAQLLRANRQNFQSQDVWGGTPDELRDAFTSYTAYFGRYTWNPQMAVVEHHVDASLYPNWTGGIQRRFVTIEGGKLELATEPVVAGAARGVFVLVWKRCA